MSNPVGPQLTASPSRAIKAAPALPSLFAAAAAVACILSSVAVSATEVSSWSEFAAAVATGNSYQPIVLKKDISVADLKSQPSDSDKLKFGSGNWRIDADGHNIVGYKASTGNYVRGGWTAIQFGYQAEASTSLTLENLGKFDDSLLHSLIDETNLPNSNIGWHDDGWHSFISADGRGNNNEASLTINKSVFQGNTTQFPGGVIVLTKADLTVTSSLFVRNQSQILSGSSISSTGASNIRIENSTFYGNVTGIEPYSSMAKGTLYSGGSNSSITIENSVFQNNQANTAAGAVYVADAVPLRISRTIFHGNSATNSSKTAYAGALYAFVDENGAILIDSSSFTENSVDASGGALVIEKAADATEFSGLSVVQDSLFMNNEAGSSGAGIAYNVKGADINNFLVAKNANTLFRNNRLTGSAEDGAAGEDIWLNSETMRLSVNAYADRIIEFSGSISASQGEATTARLLLNVNDGLKTIDNLNNLEAVDSGTDPNAGKGTIIFRSRIENTSVELGGGTLVLADGADLGSSTLTINGTDTVISTIDPLPFDQTTGASALYALENVQASTLQTLRFKSLAGMGAAQVQLDVDLDQAKADFFEVAETSDTTPRLQISHWNVLADATQNEVVVAVADKNLKDAFCCPTRARSPRATSTPTTSPGLMRKARPRATISLPGEKQHPRP